MGNDSLTSSCPQPPPDPSVVSPLAPSMEVSPAMIGSSSSLLRPPLMEAPILLLVYFHEAMRAELADLHRVASEALEAALHDRGFVIELLRRFKFLKLVYNYHCLQEDEVIFEALDSHVPNVACTYSLEHKSIEGLFDSIFYRLNETLEENENVEKPFQELVFCIGTINTFICQHMVKEEEQIFPLLVRQFSKEEQASLVWQFFCNVPVVLLEDLIPWTLSFLSPDEKIEVACCLKAVVPEEKSLLEMVASWLATDKQSSLLANTKNGEVHSIDGLLKSCLTGKFPGESWVSSDASSTSKDVKRSPLDGLHIWHDAIEKKMIEILQELYQLRNSRDFSNLDIVVVQLKHLADVLTFYSNALEKLFYPLFNELVKGCLASPNKQDSNENHIEGLQKLLKNSQCDLPLCKFVEKLCREVEYFIVDISKQFAFRETEVFPIITKYCSHATQRQLLYMSLHMMPLGLLNCVITWFSSHLSEVDCQSILKMIKQEHSLVNESFASLLHEWFRIGYSGKTNAENIGKDLLQGFKSRYSFLSDGINDASLHINKQPCEGSNSRVLEMISSKKGKKFLSISSSCGSRVATRHMTLNSSFINIQLYFPVSSHPSLEIPSKVNHPGSIFSNPKPMDLIFYFHKAIKKDLDYLVFSSAQLAENVGLLTDFHKRFHLIQFLYQIHTEAEDQVAFPALEAKGNFTNISHSYTMDHKLEFQHFKKVSLVLDQISELHVSFSNAGVNMDQVMLKHYQLCMGLRDLCTSLQKLLSDHTNREEIELWPLFRECFSIEEQERIVGCILGRTKADILQDMIPWLMSSLTPEEQGTMMLLWRKITRNTMFDEWLKEWWEGHEMANVADDSNTAPSWTVDPMEIISAYLCESNLQEETCYSKNIKYPEKDSLGQNIEQPKDMDDKLKNSDYKKFDCNPLEFTRPNSEGDQKRIYQSENATCQNELAPPFHDAKRFKHSEFLLRMSQEDVEAAIRRICRDSSLDPEKKSYMIQNLLMSRWIVRQNSQLVVPSNGHELPGQHPSYRDPLKLNFGCKHYKRRCKLVSPCCNRLFTCLRCHDEMEDHSIDRKSVTEMMCMKCLKIQPIGYTCCTASCSDLSMARYYCRICKIFDDDREVYHCPYCNLCRLGRGLGIDYYHCMNCNACMSRTLLAHVCREKSFMVNCPICHEDIFSSPIPVKTLPCGHLMHSTCFKDYTCNNYTCPICGKSLGDMQKCHTDEIKPFKDSSKVHFSCGHTRKKYSCGLQTYALDILVLNFEPVYFEMLDALLAEERIPDEHSNQTQVILCNDCQKKGAAPFHWLYHKCSWCGSYNTRLL